MGKAGFTAEDHAKARAARAKAPTRKQRMAGFAASFAAMRQAFPRMALPLVDQAERGSLPAAVKLTCLDCSGWSKKEVRDCVIPGCPLYPHRPYQTLRGKNANDPRKRESDRPGAVADRCRKLTEA